MEAKILHKLYNKIRKNSQLTILGGCYMFQEEVQDMKLK